MRKVRKQLTEAIGGKPTLIQNLMINQAVMLSIRLALLEPKVLDGTLTGEDSNYYLAWSNSLTRLLARLNLTVDQKFLPPDPMANLREHLANRGAA
jgi:hypothetical protein